METQTQSEKNITTKPKQKYYECNRKAMIAYVERQKDIKFKCEICGKMYGTFTKYNHLKSKFHLNTEAILKNHGLIKEKEN
jgi:hypothetical protein